MKDRVLATVAIAALIGIGVVFAAVGLGLFQLFYGLIGYWATAMIAAAYLTAVVLLLLLALSGMHHGDKYALRDGSIMFVLFSIGFVIPLALTRSDSGWFGFAGWQGWSFLAVTLTSLSLIALLIYIVAREDRASQRSKQSDDKSSRR